MTEIPKAPVLADENFSDSQEQGIVKVLDEDNAQLAELGHKAQLHRQYGLWSVVALGVLATNTWSALGGTFIAGVYSGGSTTIIYGFILVTVANVFVLLSLAELASSYPTAGGAYHWAAVIATPRWSKIASWVRGYLNVFGWIIGTAGSSLVLGQFVLGLCNLSIPDLVIEVSNHCPSFQKTFLTDTPALDDICSL